MAFINPLLVFWSCCQILKRREVLVTPLPRKIHQIEGKADLGGIEEETDPESWGRTADSGSCFESHVGTENKPGYRIGLYGIRHRIRDSKTKIADYV